MVLIHIVVEELAEVTRITDLLIKEQLIVESFTMKEILCKKKVSGSKKASNEKQILMIARTKALLFTEINKKLRSLYGEKMPLIYALPIVYMDEEQTEELLQNTKSV